jgi:hypothetical protein
MITTPTSPTAIPKHLGNTTIVMMTLNYAMYNMVASSGN